MAQLSKRFLSFWAGFGVVPACFVLPPSPAQCQAVVWVIGPLNCGTGLSVTGLSFFCVRFFFVLPIADSPPLAAGGNLSMLVTPTVAQDLSLIHI